MSKISYGWCLLLLFFQVVLSENDAVAQDTQILGFVAGETYFQDDQLNFEIGEQDLFITSRLNDHFTFIGETVFKFSSGSPTNFNASVERIIVSYNYSGNHNVLFGKHHTPINYWNDAYHHGRVFFPTIKRPILFSSHFIPIHTTGIAFQGLNLGDLRFGYNVMIGNGLGSTDVADNNTAKSLTASLHIKPLDDLQVGLSYYRDNIDAGSSIHGNPVANATDQNIFNATVAHFGSTFELLAESAVALNDAENLGNTTSYASYLYGGWRVNDKLVPYLRYDNLSFDSEDQFFNSEDVNSIIAGVRYEISYLIVVKAEYQYSDREISGNSSLLNAQIAIGF
jgi:hypothetical protein